MWREAPTLSLRTPNEAIVPARGTVVLAPGLANAAYLQQQTSNGQLEGCQQQIVESQDAILGIPGGSLAVTPASYEGFPLKFVSCAGHDSLSLWRQSEWTA